MDAPRRPVLARTPDGEGRLALSIQAGLRPLEHPSAPLIGGPNHYDYLYGLERASILGRVRHYGQRDWYEEGAELLMLEQCEDGSWPPDQKLVDSCFAILFLKRATRRMRVPVITSAPGEEIGPEDKREQRDSACCTHGDTGE